MATLKPILKRGTLKRTKKVQVPEDFGSLGEPLNQSHPFYFGFLGAAGAVCSITLLRALASTSQVFVLIIISLFFAAGLNPAVLFIQKRGLKRPAAVATVVAGVIGFVALFIWIAIPPLVDQVNSLLANAPTIVGDLKSNSTLNHLNDHYGIIDSIQKKVSASIKDGQLVVGAFGGVIGVGKAVLSGAVATLTILILTLYFLASLPSVTQVAYRIVPATRRARVSKISDAIIFRVGAFVGGQVSVAFIAGIFALVLGFALNLPYKAALAMVVLFCGLIPLVGHFLGITIVTLVALSKSPTAAIIAFLAYLIYVQIENYLIMPRIMKHSLSIPGLVTIIAVMIGTSLLGIVGGILSVPIAAAVLLILDEVVYPRADKS
jgi:predicted PurR-regulated permease PerM